MKSKEVYGSFHLHLHEYVGFEGGHPPWMTEALFEGIGDCIEEHGHDYKGALLSVNLMLSDMGLSSLSKDYLWEVSCYREWYSNDGYMFDKEGLIRSDYLIFFLDETGCPIRGYDHCFIDDDGKLRKEYKHLLEKPAFKRWLGER